MPLHPHFMLRRLWFVLLVTPLFAAGDDPPMRRFNVGGGAVSTAEDPLLRRFSVVNADPVTTFIYIGTVSLSATPFLRSGSEYRAHYTAKVFPYFFSNESGTMAVTVPESALRRLAAGQLIEFSGTATRSDGAIRAVEGTAAPTGPAGGRIKVKIHVTKKITLVFDTSYHLPIAAAQ